MAKANSVKGHFSSVTGSDTRRMFSEDGTFLGLIVKVDGGYQVRRFQDGKTRVKPTLRQAYASIARSN